MTSLCLTMIVKNEEARIERCLRSALPWVDDIRICDTGSTDGTVATIQRRCHSMDQWYMTARHEWINFSHNRNLALDHARKSTADYLLLLDADHELVVGDPTFGLDSSVRGALTSPAYYVWQLDQGTWYQNIRLLRRDVHARYIGVTHEYLNLPEGTVTQVIPREVLYIKDHGDGSNRADKYKRDLELLMEEHRSSEENDPRTVFYIAQTYRDLGNLDLAFNWYSMRGYMGGWGEETWYALYQRAVMMERIGIGDYSVGDIDQAYLTAFDARPWRSEPLHAFARFLRSTGKPVAAEWFQKAARSIPYPPNDKLFIEEECYANTLLSHLPALQS